MGVVVKVGGGGASGGYMGVVVKVRGGGGRHKLPCQIKKNFSDILDGPLFEVDIYCFQSHLFPV